MGRKGYLYWVKVLTDHPKNRDNCFVVKYFETNFGILNENTVWHQSCASAGTWCSSCSLRMRKHTSRKLLRIKVTPDLHLTYSKNGGNLGLILKIKNYSLYLNFIDKTCKIYLFIFL